MRGIVILPIGSERSGVRRPLRREGFQSRDRARHRELHQTRVESPVREGSPGRTSAESCASDAAPRLRAARFLEPTRRDCAGRDGPRKAHPQRSSPSAGRSRTRAARCSRLRRLSALQALPKMLAARLTPCRSECCQSTIQRVLAQEVAGESRTEHGTVELIAVTGAKTRVVCSVQRARKRAEPCTCSCSEDCPLQHVPPDSMAARSPSARSCEGARASPDRSMLKHSVPDGSIGDALGVLLIAQRELRQPSTDFVRPLLHAHRLPQKFPPPRRPA